jgi:hypothetical protein
MCLGERIERDISAQNRTLRNKMGYLGKMGGRIWEGTNRQGRGERRERIPSGLNRIFLALLACLAGSKRTGGKRRGFDGMQIFTLRRIVAALGGASEGE